MLSSSSEHSKRYSSFKNNKKDVLDLNYDSDYSISKSKEKPSRRTRARSNGSLSSSRTYSRSPSASTRTGSNLKKKQSSKLSNTYTKSQLHNDRHQYSSRSRSRTRSSSSVSRSLTPDSDYRKSPEKKTHSLVNYKTKNEKPTNSKTSVRTTSLYTGEHTKTLAEKRKSFSLSQRSSSIMNKPTILTSVDENKELTPPQSCEETEYYENEKQSTSVEEVDSETEVESIQKKSLKEKAESFASVKKLLYSASKTNALYREKTGHDSLVTTGSEISSEYNSDEYETEATEAEIASDPGIQAKGFKVDYIKVYGNIDKEMTNQRNKPTNTKLKPAYKPIQKFIPDKFNVLKQQGPKYSKPMPVSKPRKEITKELAALNKQIVEAAKKQEIKPAKPVTYQAPRRGNQLAGKYGYGKPPVRRPPAKNTNTVPYGDLNKTAVKVMSAQRFKNNELQNRITELNADIDKLKEENRTLKRVHIREEIALKKHESHDTDISRMIKTHNEELGVVKDMHKKSKAENKRINNLLLEREEDLRAAKKKNEDMKKIINDKKLMDTVDLSKKLEQTEKALEEYKTKCEQNERKIEMLEKKHKHEIGVEMAHHREVKRRIELLTDENNELKVRLEEKERALDIANIYTNRAPDKQSLWKGSSSSLNNTPSETPRKKHEMERKKKDQRPPQKPVKETIAPSSNRAKPRNDTSQEMSHRNKLESENLNEEAEIEDKARQQEYEEKEREANEKARRLRLMEHKAAEEEMHLKRIKEEENERLRKQKQIDEENEMKRLKKQEEDKRREKELQLEEEDRKKRYISPQLINKLTEETERNSVEKSKKDDLLAKLSMMDTGKSSSNASKQSSSIFNNNSATNSNHSNNINGSSPSYSNAGGYNNSSLPPKPQNNKFDFSENSEKLHQGKPIANGRDNGKNDLLSKLFSDDGNLAQNPKSVNRTDDIFGTSKANDNDNFSSGNKKPTNSSSKITLLPWEVQEVNYNNSASKNRASSNTSVNNFNGSTIKNNNSEHVDFFSTLNNGGANSTSNKVNDFGFSKNNSFSRPKIDNKPLNLFSDTKSSYVEDIEEFSL